MGTSDISSIDDGSVTGAIATVNTNLTHYKTYTSSSISVPMGASKGSATSINIPINIDYDTYQIVSVTVSTSDVALIGSPVNIENSHKNSKRVTIALINQYSSTISGTVTIIVGYVKRTS